MQSINQELSNPYVANLLSRLAALTGNPKYNVGQPLIEYVQVFHEVADASSGRVVVRCKGRETLPDSDLIVGNNGALEVVKRGAGCEILPGQPDFTQARALTSIIIRGLPQLVD